MGKIRFYNEDDEEIFINTTKEVCPRCGGEGTHVNPNIDGNGITADEFYYEWEEDEREMYLSGGYDVPCEECHGKNVIDVPDEDDPNFPEYAKLMQAEYELRAMEVAERRAGC